MSSIRVKIKNIEDHIKRIGTLSPALQKGGVYVVSQLLKKWESGVGGNDETLQSPPINEKYKKTKQSYRGVGTIDMTLTGRMKQSLDVRNITERTAQVTFAGKDNIDKARGNIAIRPQMLKVNDMIRASVNKIFFAYIRRGDK